jgi:hypothetical protein
VSIDSLPVRPLIFTTVTAKIALAAQTHLSHAFASNPSLAAELMAEAAALSSNNSLMEQVSMAANPTDAMLVSACGVPADAPACTPHQYDADYMRRWCCHAQLNTSLKQSLNRSSGSVSSSRLFDRLQAQQR